MCLTDWEASHPFWLTQRDKGLALEASLTVSQSRPRLKVTSVRTDADWGPPRAFLASFLLSLLPSARCSLHPAVSPARCHQHSYTDRLSKRWSLPTLPNPRKSCSLSGITLQLTRLPNGQLRTGPRQLGPVRLDFCLNQRLPNAVGSNIVFYGALCTQAFLYFSNSAKQSVPYPTLSFSTP